MARLELFNNIFDLRDKELFSDVEGKTVRDILSDGTASAQTYSSMVEVYNPDTGETQWCAILDDGKELNVQVMVNGRQSAVDYVIQKEDLVEVLVIPGKDSANTWAVIGSVALIIGGFILSAYTGGASLALGAKLGLGLLAGALITVGTIGVAHHLMNPKDKKGATDSQTGAQSSITGTNNEPLEDAFPLLIGKRSFTPKLVGSVYNEFVYDDGDYKTWFGSRQKAFELLAIAYAPVYVEDIKFGELVAVKNKNHVLSGLLPFDYKKDETGKYAVDPSTGEPILFDGQKAGYELEPMWNVNKVRMELSQFGNHRTVYPYTVKQKNFDIPLIYCYDKEYLEVAGEKYITWQGGTFPTGMRNASIKFSEGVPHKVTVGIDFPQGLYRAHSTEDGTNIYTKIPLNLVIQWRPVYKYVEANNLDNEGSVAEVYRKDNDTEEFYGMDRFYGWRNFTHCESRAVNKITYTGMPKEMYYTYGLNGVPAKQNGFYGYYRNKDGHKLEGTFYPLPNASRLVSVADMKLIYIEKYLTKSLSEDECSKLKGYTSKKGKPYVYNEYKNFSPSYGKQLATLKTTKTKDGKIVMTYRDYALSVYSKELSDKARECIDYFAANTVPTEAQNDAAWIAKNPNKVVKSAGLSVSEREVLLNKGLSKDTDTDCNPNWEGVECWSFGAASCGREVWYKSSQKDPSLESSDVTCSDNQLTAYSKSEMRFEVDACLDKEDILDLINRNPKSKLTGMNSPMLTGLTDVSIDSIEIRVLRLTPCYLDKSDGNKSFSYSDVVKWTWLKTYVVDKQKLIDDIDDCRFTAETVNEGTGQNETVSFSAIDCNPKTFRDANVHPDGPTWLNWNIEDYYSRPTSEEDASKLALLAIEAEADPLGELSNNLGKTSLTGYAITPTMLKDWTRYWYTDGVDYWYTDYYDSSSNRKLSLSPKFDPDVWIKSDSATFDSDAGVVIGDGYFYTEKKDPWDKKFFPEKIEPWHVLQLKTDDTGAAVRTDKGTSVTETVKHGNTWVPYISRLMKEHTDSMGRWIATDSFRDAFTNQNAIAQAIGFLVGQALGKDSYWYNSLPHQKFLRFWYVEQEGEEKLYWNYDTDFVEYADGQSPSFDKDKWIPSTEEQWKSSGAVGMGNGYWRSYRTPGSCFNMLVAKDAYDYTDGIDVGGSYGPLSYKCNLYVTSQQKTQSLLQTVLSCGRAYWIYDELGRMEFWNDKPRKTPVLLLTDENIISSSYSRTFEKGIAGYHGTFEDENNGYQQGEIYVLREGQSRAAHTRDILDMSVQGVTDPKQLWALLAYQLGLLITHRESWELKLTHLGNTLAVGSMIEFQSSVLEIGTDTSGRILKILQDRDYIYGFICDRTYDYRGDYLDDGRNRQGVSIFQATARTHSKIVTMRLASKSQQESGVPVLTEMYSNLPGQTNLILLEKKISRKDETFELDEEAGTEEAAVFVQCVPKEGDVIAFGNVGMTTQKAIVYQLQYDEKGKVTASVYPYFEEVYKSGDSMPVYKTGMTKKDRTETVPLSMAVTRTELLEAGQKAAAVTADAIRSLADGTYEIGKPDDVTGLTAVAYRDEIKVSWDPAGNGLSNTIDFYVLQLSRSGEFEEDGTLEYAPSSNSHSYLIDRDVDGYPEWDELNQWKLRVKAKNVYGYESEEWAETAVNVDSYGTWKLGLPVIEEKVVDRTAVLTLSPAPRSDSRVLYGTTRYKVRIRRGAFSYTLCRYWTTVDGLHYYTETHDKAENADIKFDSEWILDSDGLYEREPQMEGFRGKDGKDYEYRFVDGNVMPADTEWHTPATGADPYADHDNYMAAETRSQEERFVESSGTFTQTLPLYYTRDGIYNLVNTPYYYDVKCFNEAGDGEWFSGESMYKPGHEGKSVVALCTNIRDLVLANETAKESYVQNLSAISANLGEISQGSMAGSNNNYWTLSDKRGARPSTEGGGANNSDFQGAFRVGGDRQYFLVKPVLDRDGRTVINYEISLMAENISLTNSGLDFTAGTYVYGVDPNIRLKLSMNGITVQRKINSADEWGESNASDVGTVSVITTKDDGGNVYASSVFTNDPKSVHFGNYSDGISSEYHFSGTVLDEKGLDPKGLSLSAENLKDGGFLVETAGGYGLYDGRISFTHRGQTVVLSKSDGIRIGDWKLNADGTKEEMPSAVVKRMNDSYALFGLTEEQAATKIFRLEE